MSPRAEIILRSGCAELVILFTGSALTECLRITAGYLAAAVRYIIIIIIIIIIISLSSLCRVAIHIFPGQTMSLGDTLLQLFCLCCLWCLYV